MFWKGARLSSPASPRGPGRGSLLGQRRVAWISLPFRFAPAGNDKRARRPAMAEPFRQPYLEASCLETSASLLPKTFRDWFESRGWAPRSHQLDLLAKAREGRSVLLVAPTGAGKTLAGFLPSLVELSERGPEPGHGQGQARAPHPLHLALEGARHRRRPQSRNSGGRDGAAGPHRDPHGRYALAQARPADRAPAGHPAHHAGAAGAAACPCGRARTFFKDLRRVVLDELHSLVTSKRGDLLSLGLARLMTIAPQATAVGLSATVREPDDLRRYLVPQRAANSLPLVGEG